MLTFIGPKDGRFLIQFGDEKRIISPINAEMYKTMLDNRMLYKAFLHGYADLLNDIHYELLFNFVSAHYSRPILFEEYEKRSGILGVYATVITNCGISKRSIKTRLIEYDFYSDLFKLGIKQTFFRNYEDAISFNSIPIQVDDLLIPKMDGVYCEEQIIDGSLKMIMPSGKMPNTLRVPYLIHGQYEYYEPRISLRR